MKVTADTNVLLRGVIRDHPAQVEAAETALRNASLIAITLSSLCEFCWVLRSLYDLSGQEIAAAIRRLLAVTTVSVNRPAVEAGLAMLEAGGDFADGVIAYEGLWQGGATFVSFDRQAVRLLKAQGHSAKLLP